MRMAQAPRTRNARRGTGRSTAVVVQNEWASATTSVDVRASVQKCWHMFYHQRERFPEWMVWLTDVRVDASKPAQSEWTLSQTFLGEKFTFSWVSEDNTPVLKPIRKMSWRSISGLNNEGAVRFFSREQGKNTRVQMTISYEVPDVLKPVAESLKPFVEQRLHEDLQRFAQIAEKEAKEEVRSTA